MQRFFLRFSLLLIIPLFNDCTPNFKLENPVSRRDFLQKSGVFHSTAVALDNTVTGIPTGDTSIVLPFPVTNTGTVLSTVTTINVPVLRVCSNDLAATYGSVQAASSLEVRVLDASGSNIVCRATSPSIRSGILSSKILAAAMGCNLADGQYVARVALPSAPASSTIASAYSTGENFSPNGIPITVSQRQATFNNGGNSMMAVHAIARAVDTTDPDDLEVPCEETPPPVVAQNTWGGDSGSGGDGGGGGDPLIINLHTEQKGTREIPLTSPGNGVFFDLFGLNAKPTPHAKQRVSWVKDPMFAWLVKPDTRGAVNGIDELFGNNTVFPLDRSFSKDGFAALRKYDGMSADGAIRVGSPDGMIDRRDPIFEQLRVWYDGNLDGIATANELFSLAEMGMTSIDLNGDPNYYERDDYGNVTTMRSVVKMKDGSLRLIFDVWLQPAR